MKKKFARLMILPVAVVLLAYIGGGAYLFNEQETFIFPDRINMIDGKPLQPFVENVTTPDGTVLNGLVIPANNATNAPLVLAFGGNAHDVTGFTYFLANTIYERLATVVGFSYRGYPNANGKSEGKPSQATLFADALFLYDHFTERFKPSETIAVGYSLGSSVATYLATQRPLTAVGLVTPFTSIADIAAAQYPMYPVNSLLKHPFKTEEMLAHVEEPVSVLIAGDDGLIPAEQSPRVVAAIPHKGTITTLPQAHHGNILDQPEAIPFLRALLPQ